MISDVPASCVVKVREHPRAAWRSLGPSCRIAEAMVRALDVRDTYHAVRVVQDGRVLFEACHPAPSGDSDSCPQTS